MDAHELVSLVKDLALELGRTPTRYEFTSRIKGGDYKVNKMGGYTVLLKAAGLDTYDDRRAGRKIDNSIFERDIESHLESYKPKQIERASGRTIEQYQRTLFIGDVHAPFANLPLLERIYRFAESEQPEVIVQMGDLYDLFSHGRFPRSHNLFTPREEHQTARAQAETMWSELKKAAPRSRCIQLWGNHDCRSLKRILESYPQAEDWVEEMMTRMMSFEGVELQADYREELRLPGDVLAHHGYLSRLGDHRDSTLYNMVVAHTHVGGVVYRNIRGRVLWEMNAGLAGDPEAKGLSYTPQRIVKWTPGFGWLDEYGPRFIPG